MGVTDGIGQTPCSFEHYLVTDTFEVFTKNMWKLKSLLRY